MLNTVRLILNNSAIRHETLQGKNYLVAPMVMLTEGVHNGSNGPLLYKGADCQKAAWAWNMKPVVVYHPVINGSGISAADPAILESQQVGMVLNTVWDGKLRAEAWIDEALATKVDERVLVALEENKMMEVSTGLFTENVQGEGEWEGKPYTAIATNHQPDHLALLPDKIGACSIEDGAGLLQLNEQAKTKGLDLSRIFNREMNNIRLMVGNAMSHSNIHSALGRAIKEKLNTEAYVWVMDVYDDNYFVYEIDDDKNLYKLGYAITGEVVTLIGEPIPVVQVTEYRTLEGEFVGNGAHKKKSPKKENADMDKKKLVDNLIANKATKWVEADREALMAMNEDNLDKMTPNEVIPEAPIENAPAEKPVAEKPVVEVAPVTLESFIKNAPPEMQDLLTNAVSTHNAAKDQLIESIVANKNCKFSKEFLGVKGIEELQGLALLAINVEEVVPQGAPTPIAMFAGASTPQSPVSNEQHDEEDLAMPTMNFEPETANK